MASNNFAAQPTRGFSDRLQTYWDHPHPQGLVGIIKAALNGIGEAVQGSIAATSTPSTEQEAFWQNQGRDRGPVGALQAASLLTPLAPGVAGGRFAGPIVDALRNRPSSLPGGASVIKKGPAGAAAQFQSGSSNAAPLSINGLLPYLKPIDGNAAQGAVADGAGSAVRFVSRNPNLFPNSNSPGSLGSNVVARAE